MLVYQLRFGVRHFVVRIKLGLQRPLIFLAAWAMTGPLRLERHGGALRAVSFDRNIAQPFRNAQSRLFHCLTLPSKE